MKKRIIELGKKYNLNLHVTTSRDAFDIIIYDINVDTFVGDSIGVYVYYTGKTSTGVTYNWTDKDEFLAEIEGHLKQYLEKGYVKH